jgi:hypothetical protein
MKLVMTLLVRDEVDVVEAHLAFHLNTGVDFVVATDHESLDGTTDILERYVREGYVRRIPEQGPMQEVAWRTRMARLAVAEHGADWVINADADQFWWPRGGDLRDVVAAVPGRFGAIRAVDRVFVPRPPDGRHFAERMTHRLSARAPINAPASTYRPLARVIHRGHPGVVVSLGNHSISGAPLETLEHWHPIEVLHFPWRSPEQMARKARHFVQAGPRHSTGYHTRAYRAVTEERFEAHFAELAVTDDELGRGYGEGVIVADTRVRDVLRTLCGATELREEGTAYRLEPGRSWPAPQVTAVDAAYAAEAAVLRDAEAVRSRRLLDDLEQRVRSLEARKRHARQRHPQASAI